MNKNVDIQELYTKFKSSAIVESNSRLFEQIKSKYDTIIHNEVLALRDSSYVSIYLDQIKEFLSEYEQEIQDEDGKVYLKSTKAFLAMKALFISRSNSLSSFEDYFNTYLQSHPFDKTIMMHKQEMANILHTDQAIQEFFNNEEESISTLIKNTIRLSCVAVTVLLGYFLYKKYSISRN